jgi:Flp pilus assembly pilin Flp
MLRILGKKAQTTAEYAILIALIVGAVVAMQVYVKRGIQGRVKDVVDHTGSGGEVGMTGDNLTFKSGQYEPYYQKSEVITNQTSGSTEEMLEGGSVERGAESNVNVNRNATVTGTGAAD